MPKHNRYTVQYRNADGVKVELCVEAEHVTEAVEAAMHEIPSLKTHPHRIFSVVGGCA